VKSTFVLFLLIAPCLAEAATARTLQLPGGVPEAEIQRALEAAVSGDTVMLAAGTYTITKPIVMKSGINLTGTPDGHAVLDASAQTVPVVFKLDRLDRVGLRQLEFRNITLAISGVYAHTQGCDIAVDQCRFRDTKRAKGDPTPFIVATLVTRVTIRDCAFLRSAACHGNGVTFWRAHDCRLEQCRFGEDGREFPADQFGHFKNAVYANGWGKPKQGMTVRCRDIKLMGNVLRRSRLAIAEEDHGIYVLGVHGLVIEDNDVSGWTTELTGGAIKARDGCHYLIRRNRCTGSGILLYNYRNCVYDLEDVQVTDNVVRTATWDEATAAYRATGISYWRNHADGTERSIRIEGNRVENGVIVIHRPVNPADFNAEGGGVRNNQADAVVVAPGVVAEGNRARLPNWSLPPLPVPPPPQPLSVKDLGPGEGLIDGLNKGVLRVLTKSGMKQIPFASVQILAPDGRELQGSERIPYLKRGAHVTLTEKDGSITAVRARDP